MLLPTADLPQQLDATMSETGPSSPLKPRKIGVYDRPARADFKRRAVPIALAVGGALALAALVVTVLS
jgi:hypothetical protein